MKRIKTKHIHIVLALALLIGLGGFGAYQLNKSSAATTYQPLAAGVNFQAGWQTAYHTDAENRIIVDKMKAAGIKWVRIDIGWGSIEEGDTQAIGDKFGDETDPTATYTGTSVNQWYVKKIDNAVNYARSQGIQVMGIFWVSAKWNREGGINSPTYVRPAGAPTYPEYAEGAAWAAKYWSGRIDNWEIWNEADPDQKFWVNPDGTWAGTTNYVNLLKAAYPAMKRGNPNAKIMNSGGSSVDTVWYNDLYNIPGFQESFDIMSVHPYESPADVNPTSTSGSTKYNYLHIPALRQLMIDKGDEGKPIWVTEFGFSTHANTDLDGDGTVKNWNRGVTEDNYGTYLINAYDYAKKNWPYVERIFVYSDRDRNDALGTSNPEGVRHQNYFGLLKNDANGVAVPKTALTNFGNYLNSLTDPVTTYPDIDANVSVTTPSQIFGVANPPANESSGIAVSQGMYLVHNDSGGTPTVYAYNKSGQLVATITVPGVTAVDWEDISVAPGTGGSGTDEIYIGDIGDNAGTRTDLKIYKFTIPSIDKTVLDQSVTAQNVVAYPISYSDGISNAETLAVNPVTKKIYIVTKRGSPAIYESPATLSTSSDNVFTRKNAMPLQYATAGDFSKDGKYFVNTNGTDTRVWSVSNNDVLAAITASPNGTALVPPALAQLEGITFTPDAKHILFNTEGGSPSPVWAAPNPLSVTTTLKGDFDGDKQVTVSDLSTLLTYWGTKYTIADLNNDGPVNVSDLSALLSNWTIQ